jgi:corrinoid protein of di/trimethylamine methyltransferase
MSRWRENYDKEEASMTKEELFKALCDVVVKGDHVASPGLAQQVIEMGIEPSEAIVGGLSAGMKVCSDLFDRREYFVPELMCAARAMNAAVDVLRPYIKVEAASVPRKIVIGTVQGDIHDVGKNIVCMMANVAGYTVYDMGRDVKYELYLTKAMEVEADIIGMSALMTTTMEGMYDVIELFKKEGYRDQVKIVIGGAPTTQRFADEIGADGWAPDAPATIKMLEALYAPSEVKA